MGRPIWLNSTNTSETCPTPLESQNTHTQTHNQISFEIINTIYSGSAFDLTFGWGQTQIELLNSSILFSWAVFLFLDSWSRKSFHLTIFCLLLRLDQLEMPDTKKVATGKKYLLKAWHIPLLTLIYLIIPDNLTGIQNRLRSLSWLLRWSLHKLKSVPFLPLL